MKKLTIKTRIIKSLMEEEIPLDYRSKIDDKNISGCKGLKVHI